MERRPLVIVGSGPAGTASALFLQAKHPELAAEAIVLEKARHPRPKVCAGGLIPHTLLCLQELQAPLGVPSVVAHRTAVEVPGRTVRYDGRDLCRVVRRDEFDHWLVQLCRQRGIEVREAQKVCEVRREQDGVRVETEHDSYHAQVVIGADGSGSVVRRQVLPDDEARIGRAVMSDVPLCQTDWSGFAEARYDFNFLPVSAGLRGYAWAFPCVIAGVPHVNVGAYSVDAYGTGKQLARVLEEELRRLGVADAPVKSFPIRWYGCGAHVAAPRVMLAGDAAGVDPLMGEGISFAFEYGRRAAAATARALAAGDFSLADYERSVTRSWLGKKLRRLGLATRLFYGPTSRLWFALAARSRRGQEIGIRWYNGVDGWDQRGTWQLLWTWLRGVSLA